MSVSSFETGEGSASPERTPHPPCLRQGTFSHKGRGDFPNLDFSYLISMSCLANKFDICARLHIGSKIKTHVLLDYGYSLRRRG